MLFGNLTRANNKKIDRPRKVAQRTIGSELPSVDSIYLDRILTKFTRIMRDSTHPLFSDYNYNMSGIRLCVPAPDERVSEAHLYLTLFTFLTVG